MRDEGSSPSGVKGAAPTLAQVEPERRGSVAAPGKRSYAPDPKVKPRGPKKTGRVIDRKATTRATLKHRSCGICGDPAATGHHVLSRQQGGDDTEANLVPLCGSGTTECHGDIEAEKRKARKALGEHIRDNRPDTVAYVLGKLGDEAGRDWFRRRLYVTVR